MSQRIQHILLKIHQYRVQVIYKPGPDIFIADWLLRHNHTEGKDQLMKGMELWVDIIQTMTDMPECLSMTELQQASSHDNHLQKLKYFMIKGWPHSKDEISEELKPYWSYKDELAVIDGTMLKGRCIIIPNSLRQQVLNKLHINHMGIEKTKLLVCEYVYWHSINADIEKYIKQCATCPEFQQTQAKEKIIHHEIPLWPWEAVGADIFHFNNINYLCVVDYNSKFPIIRKLQELSAEHLINAVSSIFAKYGIPWKLMSDTGTYFVSEKFRHFCKSINVEEAVSLAYHHQSNGQVEACIKFIKQMFKKCVRQGQKHSTVTVIHYVYRPRPAKPSNHNV